MDNTTESGLAGIIAEYCKACGISEMTFGTRAVRDGRLARRLREGKTITLETRRTILAYISDNPAPSGGAHPAAAE